MTASFALRLAPLLILAGVAPPVQAQSSGPQSKGPEAGISSTPAVPPATVPSSTSPSAPTLRSSAPVARHDTLTGWATSVVRLRPATSSEIALARAPDAKPTAPATSSPTAPPPHALLGMASFYWQFATTASGEAYDPKEMTAAHRTLPFGTRVKVTNLVNGRTVVVRVNNRGPYKPGRVIDLSEAAADELDMRAKGIVPVKLEVLTPG